MALPARGKSLVRGHLCSRILMDDLQPRRETNRPSPDALVKLVWMWRPVGTSDLFLCRPSMISEATELSIDRGRAGRQRMARDVQQGINLRWIQREHKRAGDWRVWVQ